MEVINHKRPKLKNISRPAAWGVLTFSILNICLGLGLFFSSAKALEFFIINDFMTPQVWGGIFFTIGLVKLYGYVTNHWGVMRYANVPALFTKLFWLIALTVRQIEDPGSNSFLILMFAALASLQISLYLYFPTDKEADSKTPVGNITIAKEIIK